MLTSFFADADHLFALPPLSNSLTVSRNTITSSKFLAQLSRTLVKRSLDLFSKLALNEPDKYAKLYELVGQAFKLGIADGKSSTERDKLAKLLRFETNHNQSVSLEQVSAPAFLVVQSPEADSRVFCRTRLVRC